MAETSLSGLIGVLEEEKTRLQVMINSLRVQHQRAGQPAGGTSSQDIVHPKLPDNDDVQSPVTRETEILTGQHPFTSSQADIVLRSCDGVEYNLFMRILSEGSPFFSTMFSLPGGSTRQDGAPILDLSEHSRVLTPLFELLYPLPDPQINYLDNLNDLIAAAIKYDLQGPLHTLRQTLISPKFANVDAFRVFSIAVRHQLMDEIAIAAKNTFNLCLLDMPISDDHKYMTGYEFFRLIKLHQRRSREAQEIIRAARSLFKCPGCYRRTSTLCSTWWSDFEQRACEELQRRPSTKIIFSPTFIARSAKIVTDANVPIGSRCTDCAFEILNSQGSLESLRIKIDSLPVEL